MTDGKSVKGEHLVGAIIRPFVKMTPEEMAEIEREEEQMRLDAMPKMTREEMELIEIEERRMREPGTSQKRRVIIR